MHSYWRKNTLFLSFLFTSTMFDWVGFKPSKDLSDSSEIYVLSLIHVLSHK